MLRTLVTFLLFTYLAYLGGQFNDTDIVAHYQLELTQECDRFIFDIHPGTSEIVISNLKPNQEHYLYVSALSLGEDIDIVWNEGDADIIGYNDKSLQFRPLGSKIRFYVSNNHSSAIEITNSICNQDQKRKKILTLRDQSPQFRTPPSITPGGDPTQLVEDVFIQSGCFGVDNVQFSGNPSLGIGEFSGASDVFSFDEGIVISTGNVAEIGSQNILSNDFIDDILDSGGDADLAQISGNPIIEDAQILTFTFTPTSSQISFDYVFASEEYCDYVGSINDVFGFFISGPGINGPFQNNAENIALIPGTNEFVSINSVNYESNSEFYLSNVPPTQAQVGGGCTAGELNDLPNNPNDIILDGFTTTFTAVADVIPCETYTIKLAIGDASDPFFGSAVFLAANSFFLGDNTDFTVQYISQSGSSIKEDCNNDEVCIIFTRAEEDSDLEAGIPIFVSSGSVAIEGVDFPDLPDSIFFAAGATETELCLGALPDDIEEGIELLQLEFENVCPCDNPLVDVFIEDNPSLEVEFMGDSTLCVGQDLELEAVVISGNEPYEFEWNTGETTASISASPTTTSTYTVTVTDDCENMESFDFLAEVIPTPSATLMGGGILCSEDNNCVTLSVDMTGEGPWDLSYSLGSDVIDVSDVMVNPYEFEICSPTTVTLLSVADRGCPGDVSGEIAIPEVLLVVEDSVYHVDCFGESTGAIDLTVSGGTEPYSFSWSEGSSTEDLTDVPAGIYSVEIEDANGCMTSRIYVIEENSQITINLLEVTNVDCSGPNSGSALVQAFGGTGELQYSWSNGATGENPMNLSTGTYSVTVTDELGCSSILGGIVINQDALLPVAEAGPDQSITCTSSVVSLTGSAMFVLDDASYSWSTTGGNIVSDPTQLSIQVDQAGVYYFMASNGDLCSDIDSVIVTLDTSLAVISIQGDSAIDCLNSQATLQASGDADWIYQWTSSNGNFVSGIDSPSVTVDEAGVYLVTVTDPDNGCNSVASFEVFDISDNPDFGYVIPDLITCTIDQVNIDILDNSQSSISYLYSWSTEDGLIASDSSSQDITVSSAGTYTVTIFNPLNGCDTTFNIIVSQDIASYNVSIATPDVLTCQTDSIVLDGTNSEMGPDFIPSWNSPLGLPIEPDGYTATITEPGLYIFSILNTTTGCSSSDSILITLNGDLPNATATFQNPLTCLTTVTQLIGNSTTEANLSFTWMTPDGNIVAGMDQDTAEVDAPGTYVLTVSNLDNGCSATSTVMVPQNIQEPITQFLNATPAINCLPSTDTIGFLILSSSDDISLSWSTDVGDIIVENSDFIVVGAPGNYFLTVVDQENGCSVIDTISVEDLRTAPSISLADTAIINCIDTLLSLDGESPDGNSDYDYQWTSSTDGILSNPNLPQVTVDEPGVYVLEVINSMNGCSALDSITIVEDFSIPEVNIVMPDTLTCFNPTVTLVAQSMSDAPLSFEWTTQDGNILADPLMSEINVDAQGVYSLEVTNQENGCSDILATSVASNVSLPNVSIAPPDNIDCLNPQISLDGSGSDSGPNYQYLWDGPDNGIESDPTQELITISLPGLYNLTITNILNGCSSVDSVIVLPDNNSPLAMIAEPLTIDCNNTSITLDASSSTIDQDYLAYWILEGDTLAQNVSTLSVSEPGSYTLDITRIDNNCRAVDSVDVLIDTISPLVSIDPVGSIDCNNPSVLLDGSSSTFDDQSNFEWTLPDMTVINGELSTDATIPGTYSLNITNSQNGCSDTEAISVNQDTVSPTPQLSEPQNLDCDVNQVQIEVLNPNSNWEYLWETSDGSIESDPSLSSITVSAAGNYSVTVSDSSNGCSTSLSVEVTDLSSQLPISLSEPEPITCDVDYTVIELLGVDSMNLDQYSIQWSTLDGVIADSTNPLVIEVSEYGTYQVELLDPSNQCTSTAMVEVIDLREEVMAQLQTTQPSCEETFGAVTWSDVVGNAPIIASIDGGNTFANVTEFTQLPPGQYNLILEDNIGCQGSFAFEIINNQLLDVQLSVTDTVIRLGESVQIFVNVIGGQNIDTIIWSGQDITSLSCSSCLDPIASPVMSTIYNLYIESIDGCSVTRSVTVQVDQRVLVYFPNVFSPNGDGVNDFFGGFAEDFNVIKVKGLSIYDRWGEKVFDGVNLPFNQPELGWDGRYKGDLMNPGVFIYEAEVELASGDIVIYQGDLTLIR